VKHIADAESEFKVVNITPDFCRVDGCVVPFDIKQDLSEERTEYAKDFFARGKRVLRLGSVVGSPLRQRSTGVPPRPPGPHEREGLSPPRSTR
jgi:hypothetical protein